MGSIKTNTAAEASGISIVDFAEWKPDSSPKQKQEIAKQLTEACKTVGFVYIINHKVPPTRLAEAFSWSKKLFDLKREEKMLAPHPSGSAVHRGYSWPGLEKVSNLMGDEEDPEAANNARKVSDVKESYEIGSESNADQPNVWLPDDVLPGFRTFMTSFYWECHENAKMILQAIALGIGIPNKDFFLKFHSGNNNQLRLLHYPPISAAEIENNALTRLDAHTDWPSITMVFQDDCGGLQIENPHKLGEFVDAPPLKNAIVMNIGDLMQRWTNDTLKSTLHRVTLPPPDPSSTTNNNNGAVTRARYSIPYFVSPEGPTVVECLPSCVDGDNPPKHAPIVWNEYMLMRARMQYEHL